MTSEIPTAVSDPINAKILAVSEDLIAGFQRHPLPNDRREIRSAFGYGD
jgi:hypothetical protein